MGFFGSGLGEQSEQGLTQAYSPLGASNEASREGWTRRKP